MSVPVLSQRHRVAVACGCVLGEGPIWDWRTATLRWVDIAGGRLWSWRPDAGEEATSRDVGQKVGFVVLTPDPDVVLLGLKDGVARLSLPGGEPETLFRPEPDRPGNRLNDAGTGPDGSLYLGTMDDAERHSTGAFYRWTGDGLTRFGEAARVTNGPTVDGPNRLLYASDTANGRVYRHRLSADGVPGPAELFVAFGSGEGHPDGMSVDEDGHVWICHFGGSRVTRFSPAGEAVLIVPMPTAQVTKAAFGGPDLDRLYVTTAARDRDPTLDTMAGHVFEVEVGVRGLPADPCTVGHAAQ